jgi:hypothetical protein
MITSYKIMFNTMSNPAEFFTEGLRPRNESGESGQVQTDENPHLTESDLASSVRASTSGTIHSASDDEQEYVYTIDDIEDPELTQH